LNHGNFAQPVQEVWWYGEGMASSKVTFTLDAATIRRLRDAAERLAKPQSAVVREAIEDFHDRLGKLSERERTKLLRAFDQLVPKIPGRPLAAIERELATLRKTRRTWGRKTPIEKQR
jgi:hypothetical protein